MATLPELRGELEQLRFSRPSLGWPVVTTALGGGLLVGGTLYAALVASLLMGVGNAFFVIGVSLAVAGLVLLPIGIVMLVATLHQRAEWSAQREALRERVRTLEQAAPTPLGVGPLSSATVASF